MLTRGICILNRRSAATMIGAALVAVSGAGCGPGKNQAVQIGPGSTAANAPLSANVIGIRSFVHSYECWLWNDDHTKPVGLIIHALYLEGPGGKGVFGDGIIRPMLYMGEWDDQGRKRWTLVKEWKIDPQAAVPFRAKKYNPVTGWGYRFDLRWDDEPDLAGQEIRLIVVYDRTDGLTIRSTKKDKKVPQESS